MNELLVRSQGNIIETNYFINWARKQSVLVSILKDENAEATLSSLYILQLTVSLFYQLSNHPFYFATLQSNDLEIIDSLLMRLIPRYCVPENRPSVIVPSTPEEHTWAKQRVSGKVIVAYSKYMFTNIFFV